MASTTTTRLGLEKIATGEQENTWGGSERANQDLLDQALGGVGSVSVAGAIDVTLTKAQWVDRVITFTGTLTGSINVIFPTIEWNWKVKNATTGSFTLTCKTVGGAGVLITQTLWSNIHGDGADIKLSQDTLDSSVAAITSGTITGITDLAVADGGTGASTLTDHGVVLGSGTAAVSVTGAGTTGQVLTSNGAAADPTYQAINSFPTGTLMLFQQTAAPTGWTKEVTHDDKSLRVVSGAAGSGGATAFTSVFGSGKTTDSTAISVAQMPAHDHTGSYVWGGNGEQTTPSGQTANSQSASNFDKKFATMVSQGGGSGHTHTLSLDLQYVDLIICSKDA